MRFGPICAVVTLALGLFMSTTASAELIVLAAPRAGDSYYDKVSDQIFDFQTGFARRIKAPDRVLILTDKQSYKRYADAIGAENVAVAPMEDIWLRDFAPSNAVHPVHFRYTAEGQGGGVRGQDEADFVQDRLAKLLRDASIKVPESSLLNDGGNFVDDYAGNVVISRKFLRDNNLSENAARAKLTALPGIRHVAFIEADEQGGLEHADGVVSFVDTNTLIINSYPDDPEYAARLKADLRRGLGDVKIHEIVTPYDGTKIHDGRFGSACGLYTNALVTPKRIYLPQFGIPEDKTALAQIRAVTKREVVPVHSDMVCSMGGGVRCMSWQLRGVAADRLLAYFKKS